MKAHELIDSPEKFIGGAYVEDNKYCAVGAFREAYGITGHNAYCEASNMLKILLGDRMDPEFRHVEDWNDNNDWQTVYNTLKELGI